MKFKKLILSAAACTLVGGVIYTTQSGNSLDLSSFKERAVDGPQKNICSITINSDDEIKTFKNKFSSDGRFKFTELINGNVEWFDQACDSNIQCDVLVISGHFAGTFVGKSGHNLSLSQLEAKSCSKKCTGILEKPKEIYLFGCNTLASKGSSSRTPEQYLQALLEDNFERSFAERMVEARYGVSGEENINRMKRAFPGVPVIYGFCDKAPLGYESGPLMQKYLSGKSKDDYFDRLNRLESVQKNLQPYSGETIQQLIDQPLASAYKSIGRCFQQVTGIEVNDDITRRICYIRNESHSIVDRAQHLDFLMRSDKRLSYIDLCNDFLNEVSKKSLTPPELAAVARVKNNPKLRDELMSVLNKLSFFLGFDYATLAVQLGADKSQVLPILSKDFTEMIIKGLNVEEVNLMINSDGRIPYKDYIRISYDEINQGATWTNANSVQAIGLTKTKDPAIIRQLQEMSSTTDRKMRRSLVEALITLDAVTIQLKDALIAMLYDEDSDVRANAIRALGQLTVYDEKIMNEVMSLISRETDNWTLKKLAIYFIDVKFDNAAIQSQLAKMLNHKNAEVRQYSASALAGRKLKDYTVFEALVQCLNDTSPEAKSSCQYALRKNRQLIPPDIANRISSKDHQAIFGQ
jgi:HEAT repeat